MKFPAWDFQTDLLLFHYININNMIHSKYDGIIQDQDQGDFTRLIAISL